jgi:hypothetical protein
MDCNTHVHGSNARNFSVQPSLPQSSKNAMSPLLSLMFFFNKITEQEGRTNSAGSGMGRGEKVTQTMYNVSKCKNNKIKNK